MTLTLRRCLLTATMCVGMSSFALPGSAFATTSYLSDTGSHPPPAAGSYAYYATYGTFGPDHAGFPAVGGTFVDPVFGNTIRRLTNELPQYSDSENYAKNGFINADATLMHHRSQSGHNIISTTTGQVVRANVPGNFDSSFAPDDADVWYWFNWGDITLYKYRVSTGGSAAVKQFSQALGQMGGSVDWIDRTGQYMVLHLGTALRVYDVRNDILYSGSIPDSYGGGSGWTAISPDGKYVVTATDGSQHNSFAIDHGNKVVSTTPVFFWSLCGDHGDLVSASNGKTYFVTFECYDEGAIYAVDVSLPQSTSNVPKQRTDNKKLLQMASWNDVAGHFSGVSKGALQDWFYVDVESGDDGFTSSVAGWRAYAQEIMMINVLTGEIRRLAHHRSRAPRANYFYTPRVSASWDGSLVTWVSNFGYSASGYVDLYAMNVDTGSGGSGGSGGGGSSTVAASIVVAYAESIYGRPYNTLGADQQAYAVTALSTMTPAHLMTAAGLDLTHAKAAVQYAENVYGKSWNNLSPGQWDYALHSVAVMGAAAVAALAEQYNTSGIEQFPFVHYTTADVPLVVVNYAQSIYQKSFDSLSPDQQVYALQSVAYMSPAHIATAAGQDIVHIKAAMQYIKNIYGEPWRVLSPDHWVYGLTTAASLSDAATAALAAQYDAANP
jgi:hypothetical protein